MFNIEKKKNHQDIVVLNYKKNKDDNIHKNEAQQNQILKQTNIEKYVDFLKALNMLYIAL